MNTLTLDINFYQALGSLYYAIASCDSKVRKEEYNQLKKIIAQNWLQIDTDKDTENYSAFIIEHTFSLLNNSKENADTCFNDFLIFKQKNPDLFTTEVNQIIWKTSNEIAMSIAGKNKSELILLTKLKLSLI
ncbi:hypothetical protein [Urechidicola croceus]|uniref:hypothetical protein n=1 Tax=Urechidicola croceus TaxID=1850246 RepID=UPI001E64B489|nr:hypothetical protein [Urechidicola croceus]